MEFECVSVSMECVQSVVWEFECVECECGV